MCFVIVGVKLICLSYDSHKITPHVGGKCCLIFFFHVARYQCATSKFLTFLDSFLPFKVQLDLFQFLFPMGCQLPPKLWKGSSASTIHLELILCHPFTLFTFILLLSGNTPSSTLICFQSFI